LLLFRSDRIAVARRASNALCVERFWITINQSGELHMGNPGLYVSGSGSHIMMKPILLVGAAAIATTMSGQMASGANVIPNPLEIPLESVGNRLTAAQEKLIAGKWCRRVLLDGGGVYEGYSPSAINQEHRFRKIKGSVFSRYSFSDGYSYRLASLPPDLPADQWPALSYTDKVQITIDKDGLFVVAAHGEGTIQPIGLTRLQEKVLSRYWYRIGQTGMQKVYQEHHTATWDWDWTGSTGKQPVPRMHRNPKKAVGRWDRTHQPNAPWIRCDR
jgi:hypothetical protein